MLSNHKNHKKKAEKRSIIQLTLEDYNLLEDEK